MTSKQNDYVQDDNTFTRSDHKIDEKESAVIGKNLDKTRLIKYWSYTKLQSFYKCPLYFKFKYIDQREPLLVKEMALGNLVHLALERLYRAKFYGTILSKKEILDYMKELYDAQMHKLNKKLNFFRKIFDSRFENMTGLNDVVEKGVDKDMSLDELKEYVSLLEKEITLLESHFLDSLNLILNYYDRFFINDDSTVLEIESQNFLKLGNYKYQIRIDRLSRNRSNIELIDYKFGNFSIKKFDYQLKSYSLWVFENYENIDRVILKWIFLRDGKQYEMEFTKNEAKIFKNQLKNKIDYVVNFIKSKAFLPKFTKLCKYCEFRHICQKYFNDNQTN